MRFRARQLCGLCVILLSGCGSGGPPELAVVPVSGVVLVDGEPTENLIITLDPQMKNGRPASAVSGPAGKFTIQTPGQGTGAAVGKFRVSVTDMLPPKNAPATTPVASPDGLAVETENEKSGGKTPVQAYIPETRIAARYARFPDSGLSVDIPSTGLETWKLELSASSEK